MTLSPDPTGILGGTFDPVHLGHLSVASQCAARLGLARVLLVPAGQPPHRRMPVASPEDRLAMVDAAVRDSPGLAVSDVEVRRAGPSYTVDTIAALGRAHGSLVLLLGADAALEFGSWREAATIAAEVRVAVFNRSGSVALTEESLLAAGLPPGVVMVEVDSPPISASELRADLAAGRDVSDRVPASVLQVIRERGLYGRTVTG